ncbi:hypothetical protein RJ53_06275 [Methanocalculus chunghsingensis]|uniref:DUF4349 domain-containing protein n=1 Tax=Methanocalculus chunghsingensis TaxID=156457 RepID=A0A8J7W6A8_9EURY|nr:DUF4349 domain-containing protein [Methanocalculus chunghsingensis]MBR1369121.1 hypothetical protein [Methanocalculus chunghsingensis]
MKRSYIMLILLLIGISASAGCMMADTSPDFPHGWSETVVYENAAPYERSDVAYDTKTGFVDAQVIREGEISLQSRDPRQTADEITEIAERYNGRIQSLTINSAGVRDGKQRYYVEAILRIPPQSFDAVMQEIEGTGTLTHRQIRERDVTEEYTDLHAEKQSLQRQVERYDDLLEKAVTVEEILQVQTARDTAQRSLDIVTGRLNLLESRIDEAIITVSIREAPTVGVDSGFSASGVLNTGISAFMAVIVILIVAAFALLPLAVIGGIVWLILRRRKG